MTKKVAVIIGAGPAGLTAAYELLEHTDVIPLVFEMTGDIGGISKTVNYKGNRIDIGGHRFFSKSDRVMNWWQNIMPVEDTKAGDAAKVRISYHGKNREIETKAGVSRDKDLVFLVRERLSRILHRRKLYDYPLKINFQTISNLGIVRLVKIGLSYMRSVVFPIRNEKTLEDFFINRFGRELYKTFFKDYTEKVWGVPCTKIEADWGAQRIKGLSILKSLIHAVKKIFSRDTSLSQEKTETSLIERFIYPKLGPGQMWEAVAARVQAAGGEVSLFKRATQIQVENGSITQVEFTDTQTGEKHQVEADYVFSTMPVKELIAAIDDSDLSTRVKDIASGLEYRDFMTVGILANKISVDGLGKKAKQEDRLKDNWIYIQESDVNVGRLQIFNNWSPFMVADPDKVWVGLEYFCNEGDDLWEMPDDQFTAMAIDELEKIHLVNPDDIVDSTVIRMPKAYPGYFGEAYKRLGEVREYTDSLENLFLVGRNGMHKYNNQDHSMLSAMTAVENVRDGITDKSNIWAVNAEEAYHESK